MDFRKIFLIHGGNTFKSEDFFLKFLKNIEISLDKKIKWSEEYLDRELGNDFKIIRPKMPFKENANYKYWKIYFEKFIPFIKEDDILIGNSLGGIFLAKYLSENKLTKKINSVFLISPPFDDSLLSEELSGGFELKDDLSLIEENSKNVYLMFSKDDTIVPISHSEKYREKLKNSNILIYESKNGHFIVPEFPELVEIIKNNL